MKLATGNRRPWRALLTAGLAAPRWPRAAPPPGGRPLALEGGPEAVGTQEQGAISWTLGAQYDATKTNINFRVYSSRATRIEVYIYKTPNGAQEVAKYVLTKDATTNVWSKTVSVATLQTTYGITGPVYYGYRAWGPNWPYNSTLDEGLERGLHHRRRRAAATASTPTSCWSIRTRWRSATTRSTPSNTDGTHLRHRAPRYRQHGQRRRSRPRASCWRRTPRAHRHQAHARPQG